MALPAVKFYRNRRRYQITDGPSHPSLKVHVFGPETHRDQRFVDFTVDGVWFSANVIAAGEVPYHERNIAAGETGQTVFYLWIKVWGNPGHPLIRNSRVLEGRYSTDKRTGFFQAASPSR